MLTANAISLFIRKDASPFDAMPLVRRLSRSRVIGRITARITARIIDRTAGALRRLAGWRVRPLPALRKRDRFDDLPPDLRRDIGLDDPLPRDPSAAYWDLQARRPRSRSLF